jgi:3-hydroxy acid dehydrogenase / malonic semialdehyde reductase
MRHRRSPDGYYDRYPALLEPADVARAVQFARDQPVGVCCSEITIVPVSR